MSSFVCYYYYLINYLQYGETPLDLARKGGRQSVVDYLVTIGECTDECTIIRAFLIHKKLKRFLSKSKGCRVVKSTTGQQSKLTRNKHGMVTRLTC